ncbi:MAG: hypothetical protein ABIS29_18110 [Vicinamibacterales bacterium]
MRSGALLVLAVMVAACRPSLGDATETAHQTKVPAAARQLGSWSGKGSTTLGFVSESGSFRITWTARNHDTTRPGTFQLTLRSGISGRPMKVIADHQGAGGGSVEFGDDPRLYEFLVESSGMDWSISVEETFAPRR